MASIRQDFIDEYTILLIKQYWEKPRAFAEIESRMKNYSKVFDFYQQFPDAFDIETATGDRLDKIGALVGLSRTASDVTFNDDDYRFYIRVKIAQNAFSGTMLDEDGQSLQDVINFALQGEAFVTDNYDMTLSLKVSSSISLNRLETVINLGLLPKPAGVRYSSITQDPVGTAFAYIIEQSDLKDDWGGYELGHNEKYTEEPEFKLLEDGSTKTKEKDTILDNNTGTYAIALEIV